MPWQIIHGRDRELLVSGSSLGVAEFTRDPSRALRFDRQEQARRWLDLHIVSAFGELALMRLPGSADDDGTRRGVPGHYRK